MYSPAIKLKTETYIIHIMSDQNYNSLFEKIVNTLTKYSMASMASGIEINSINEMILQHREKLLAINSYAEGQAYASEIIYSNFGFPCPINYVITDEIDLRILYEVCIVWRDIVLQQ